MKNPFPDNDVINQFIGLKNYFRKFSSRESLRRVQEIHRIARIIQRAGDDVAFDILGSVNFGMADERSDVDLVLYLDCGNDEEATYRTCPSMRFYESLLMTTILREITDAPYRLQIVDGINLRRLEKAIRNPGFADDTIARFVFYRIICRGVNKIILRPYEGEILANRSTLSQIEGDITHAFVEFTRSSSHSESFRKYIGRMEDRGLRLPESILSKVVDYVNMTRN